MFICEISIMMILIYQMLGLVGPIQQNLLRCLRLNKFTKLYLVTADVTKA